MYVRELNATLDRLLRDDDRVVVLGEDIADPYGGAFKATRGLSTAHPGRVLSTPISEGAIVGLATGLALAGRRPIAEMMFGDFVTLGFDQIVNHAAKYREMYDGQASAPIIVRLPSGGGRGYGPTHSQSLEQHLLGVPHLRMLAASLVHTPEELFTSMLEGDDPAIHVEHKSMYPKELELGEDGRLGGALLRRAGSPGRVPTVALSFVPRERCTFTVVAYGHQAANALAALRELAIAEERFGELLVPAELAPMDWAPIEQSVAVTGSLLTAEEGMRDWSWGEHVAAEIARRSWGALRRAPAVLASTPTIIPSSRDLEQEVLVDAAKIAGAMREVS